MSFENILGNSNIKNLLEQTINSNTILHSYLFVGINGIGKMLFANEFAKMILCIHENSPHKPCQDCKSCIEFSTNNHPDFLTITSQDGKSIKIEQIRFLQEKIAEKPIVSSRKVYIIEDADLMTKEAQNCLLKTLEEPPSYATIILTLSNESKILNTIRSRCTKINFEPLSNEDIKNYLNSHGIDFSFNENTWKLCNGSIGKALSLQEQVLSYQEVDNLVHTLMNGNIIDVWNNSNILYQSKEYINDLLDYMNVIFMNKLLKTQKQEYICAIEIIEQTKERLGFNANYDMSIDNLLLQIWEEFHEKYSRN